MTKFLSDCLNAPEPFFRQGLRRLEASSGHPGADIHVSLEVEQATRHKLQQLGLNPADTTPEELYHLLHERIKADDAKLVKRLRTESALHVSADGDVVGGIVHALKKAPDSKRGFGLKPARFKALIKELPPKHAMKRLGYRSLESFLKKESAVSILGAAQLFENDAWHQHLAGKYAKLTSRDFEDRPIEIVRLDEGHWRELSFEFVEQHKHNLLSLRELAALVFLPLPHEVAPGTTTACLGLGLHELNEIRACGTYLRLCQVRPDFGRLVQTVSSQQPQLNSQLLDMSIPWNLIQRYYSKLKQLGDGFAEPQIQPEDIAWHPIEATLKAIEPAFDFWSGSSHLAMLHGGKPVSLNLVDAALNCCNQIPFEKRLAHYFKDSLWHELLLRYLKHKTIEQSILHELQPQLGIEVAAV